MSNPKTRPPEKGYWKQHRRSLGCQASCADRQSDGRRAAVEFAERTASQFPRQPPGSKRPQWKNDSKASAALFLVGGGFGGGVHAVLGHFVCSTGKGLDFLTIKMIEGHAAFADGVTFFDGFGDVGLRKRLRHRQRPRAPRSFLSSENR